jgi:hypothetical protein
MPGTDPIFALREAATALLAEAPLPVVRATLRALLDGADAEPRRTSALPASPQMTRPTKLKQTPPKRSDGAWDARRREIRAAMQERDVGYADLAKQLRVTVKVLHHALGRRQPPAQALQRQLEAWLATSAPAVAAEPPFRTNGAGRFHTSADVDAERAPAV